MADYLRTATSLATYSYEMLTDRGFYANVLESATDWDGVQQSLEVQSLLGISAMGLLAKQAYDIAHPRLEKSTADRQQTAALGGMLLFAVDVVDDEIDRKDMPFEEKLRYLDAWARSLLQDDTPLSNSEYPYGGNPGAISLSFRLATYLHGQTARHGGIKKLEQTLGPLAEAVIGQMTSQDDDEQLDLTVKVGEGCGELSSAALEIVSQEEFPLVQQAAGALGVYAECVNHATEIDEDLHEGSLSYATLYLRSHGDTPANRTFVSNQLLGRARDVWQAGLLELDSRQRAIQQSGKVLVDIKYKILGHLAKPVPTPALPFEAAAK